MARIAHPLFSAPVASYATTAPRDAGEGVGTRTLAGMLLAAVLAALLVVADQLIETWADGHLLAGWVALWTVAFAALAFLAPPLRQLTSVLAAAFARWDQAATLRRQDEMMWRYAKHDPRLMAELQCAFARAGEQ